MDQLQLQIEALKEKFVPEYYKSIDVDEGWYQIVVNCDKELIKIDPNYQIFQIKQKFGGLRYYFHPSQSDTLKEMQKVIAKYEAIAKITCEATGNPGVLMRSKSGWYKTLDPEYAKTTLYFKNYFVAEVQEDYYTYKDW